MLIIFEGLDKSAKSALAKIMQAQLNGIVIRKTYNQHLYPINYSLASEYDWQAILDRVVLANPDMTFVADRSFFTQTVYQVCLGVGENTITDKQADAYNNYVKTVSEIPHLVVYCMSPRYELDSMVTTLKTRSKLDALYRNMIAESGLNYLFLDTYRTTLTEQIEQITKAICDQ